eukprot:403347827
MKIQKTNANEFYEQPHSLEIFKCQRIIFDFNTSKSKIQQTSFDLIRLENQRIQKEILQKQEQEESEDYPIIMKLPYLQSLITKRQKLKQNTLLSLETQIQDNKSSKKKIDEIEGTPCVQTEKQENQDSEQRQPICDEIAKNLLQLNKQEQVQHNQGICNQIQNLQEIPCTTISDKADTTNTNTIYPMSKTSNNNQNQMYGPMEKDNFGKDHQTGGHLSPMQIDIHEQFINLENLNKLETLINRKRRTKSPKKALLHEFQDKLELQLTEANQNQNKETTDSIVKSDKKMMNKVQQFQIQNGDKQSDNIQAKTSFDKFDCINIQANSFQDQTVVEAENKNTSLYNNNQPYLDKLDPLHIIQSGEEVENFKQPQLEINQENKPAQLVQLPNKQNSYEKNKFFQNLKLDQNQYDFTDDKKRQDLLQNQQSIKRQELFGSQTSTQILFESKDASSLIFDSMQESILDYSSKYVQNNISRGVSQSPAQINNQSAQKRKQDSGDWDSWLKQTKTVNNSPSNAQRSTSNCTFTSVNKQNLKVNHLYMKSLQNSFIKRDYTPMSRKINFRINTDKSFNLINSSSPNNKIQKFISQDRYKNYSPLNYQQSSVATEQLNNSIEKQQLNFRSFNRTPVARRVSITNENANNDLANIERIQQNLLQDKRYNSAIRKPKRQELQKQSIALQQLIADSQIIQSRQLNQPARIEEISNTNNYGLRSQNNYKFDCTNRSITPQISRKQETCSNNISNFKQTLNLNTDHKTSQFNQRSQHLDQKISFNLGSNPQKPQPINLRISCQQKGQQMYSLDRPQLFISQNISIGKDHKINLISPTKQSVRQPQPQQQLNNILQNNYQPKTAKYQQLMTQSNLMRHRRCSQEDKLQRDSLLPPRMFIIEQALPSQ